MIPDRAATAVHTDVVLEPGQWAPVEGTPDSHRPPPGELVMHVVLSRVSPELHDGEPTGWLLVFGWRAAHELSRQPTRVRVRACALPAELRARGQAGPRLHLPGAVVVAMLLNELWWALRVGVGLFLAISLAGTVPLLLGF